MKSGNLNFLETSGPHQACNGTDLPLPLTYCYGGHAVAQLAEALRYKPDGRGPFTASVVNIYTDWLFCKVMHITYGYSDQVL